MNALQRDLKKLVPLVESLGKETVAADPHRQRFHLQPPVGWLNDPNGLCQIGDEYHVFYQYGPFDPTGGVKHWGHVRSRDLFHWERLPVMLYPDEPFDCHGVYSGSALVEDGMLYLYYTGNVKHPGEYDYIKQGRAQCLPCHQPRCHPSGQQALPDVQPGLSRRADLPCARSQSVCTGWALLYGAGCPNTGRPRRSAGI